MNRGVAKCSNGLVSARHPRRSNDSNVVDSDSNVLSWSSVMPDHCKLTWRGISKHTRRMQAWLSTVSVSFTDGHSAGVRACSSSAVQVSMHCRMLCGFKCRKIVCHTCADKLSQSRRRLIVGYAFPGLVLFGVLLLLLIWVLALLEESTAPPVLANPPPPPVLLLMLLPTAFASNFINFFFGIWSIGSVGASSPNPYGVSSS